MPANPKQRIRRGLNHRLQGRAVTIEPSNAEAATPPQGEVDAVNSFLARIAAWITAGYPEGVPGPDRVPLLALLNRRLSNDEVKAVAQDLMQRGEFDNVDIGVLITQTTDELPRPEDVERVRARLAAKGWPLDDARDGEGST